MLGLKLYLSYALDWLERWAWLFILTLITASAYIIVYHVIGIVRLEILNWPAFLDLMLPGITP